MGEEDWFHQSFGEPVYGRQLQFETGTPELADRISIHSSRDSYPTSSEPNVIAAGTVEDVWSSGVQLAGQIFSLHALRWRQAADEIDDAPLTVPTVTEESVVSALEVACRGNSERALPIAIDDELSILAALTGHGFTGTQRPDGELLTPLALCAQFVDLDLFHEAMAAAEKRGAIIRVSKGTKTATGHNVASHSHRQVDGLVTARALEAVREQKAAALEKKLRVKAVAIVAERHDDEVSAVLNDLLNAHYESVAQAAESVVHGASLDADRAKEAAVVARSAITR